MQKKSKISVVLLLSQFLLLSLLTVVMGSCYHHYRPLAHRLDSITERQRDSMSFSATHHYTNNYNFVVKSDSLTLLKQQPEELINNLPTDSVVVHRHDHLVVAEIRMIPTDSIDSVWVQLARDQETFGWIHESKLLPSVVPDDPISQFISTFSDVHLLIFLVVICVIGFIFIISRMLRHKAHLVHFNDIRSFYPTLLCIIVAAAATFYASIQMFAPDAWRDFYFHPTLNPFGVSPLLSIFLISVWAMLIVVLAAVDEARRQLPFGECVMYVSGLFAVCAIDYIIFSITTLYYVGYILLVVYVYLALRQYLLYSRPHFTCGNCGARLRHKGRCPKCGAWNE